jgi:hypothetical protein
MAPLAGLMPPDLTDAARDELAASRNLHEGLGLSDRHSLDALEPLPAMGVPSCPVQLHTLSIHDPLNSGSASDRDARVPLRPEGSGPRSAHSSEGSATESCAGSVPPTAASSARRTSSIRARPRRLASSSRSVTEAPCVPGPGCPAGRTTSSRTTGWGYVVACAAARRLWPGRLVPNPHQV